ncbi:MAG: hypothetical protein OEZ34_11115 [Spirochaetia bacterium]|nr:hypothetical protein [Spirochaetia bacterium]
MISKFFYKTSLFAAIISLSIIVLPDSAQSESVIEKASANRALLLHYMRQLRPLAYNFPCHPFIECMETVSKEKPGQYIEMYMEAKRIYQEGMIFYFEGRYLEAYSRFLDSQKRSEKLLEEISQLNIDRAELMLRDSLEKKDPNNKADQSVVDISVDFSRKSKIMRDYKKPREAAYVSRIYDPRQTHYAYNAYGIEKNVEMGYKHLGLARMAREKGLNVDKHLRPNQKLDPRLVSKRIEYYLISINLSRKAKINAEFIFRLKYPYDNYAIVNPHGIHEKASGKPQEKPVIDGVRMNWSENPLLIPVDLNPIFDLRFPEEYRRDAVDARNARFDDEADVNLRMKYVKSKPEQEFLYDDAQKGRTDIGPGGR